MNLPPNKIVKIPCPETSNRFPLIDTALALLITTQFITGCGQGPESIPITVVTGDAPQEICGGRATVRVFDDGNKQLTFTIRITTDGDNTPIQSLIVIVDGVGYQIPKTEIGDSSDFMVSGPKHNVLGGRSSFEVSCNMNVRE